MMRAMVRPAVVLSLVAGLTVMAGIVPQTSSAQNNVGGEGGRSVGAGSNIPLTADAPDQYVVKRGDTLWDISKVFLREPWYWPEIWYVNPQVQNPHLIYPGDVLKLVYVEGQPRLTIAERGGAGVKRLSPDVRREPLNQAITAIPYEVIAGFAGRPSLLTKEQVEEAPYVVAMRDEHIIGGMGNEVYAMGIGSAPTESQFSVIHVEGKVKDPETNDVLGYTGVYVGQGQVSRSGEPAKLVLTESAREALQGDKLFPQSNEVLTDFVPHSPNSEVDAAVIAVRSMTVMGQYNVVALNRGTESGLEPGHVLAVERLSGSVRDKYSKGGLSTDRRSMSLTSNGAGKKVTLPPERVGVIMVFKAYDRISYGLVMETTHEIREGDRAKNP
jgi:hypothetical protein